MTIDADRIRRQVSRISDKLAIAEQSTTPESLQDLHDALHIGVTVLEDEMGVTLLQTPAQGDVATFSGGSGKDRPDVGGE